MKIGVFDSGRGGKLISQKIKQKIPQSKVTVLVDSKYFPYGNKTPQVIFARLVHFTKKFQALGCQLIVIACNTATTNAIKKLRQQFPQIIFVGVEPPIKPIAKLTKTKQIAILGTPATIKSLRRITLQQQFAQGVKVYNIVCPGLAELIETNPNPRTKTAQLLNHYLNQPINEGVDVVGLACTHYPYLIKQMQALYPQVIFYDPADAVVRHIEAIIK